MNINVKRWLVLIARYLVAVVTPLIIFAVKFDVFASAERVGALGIICLAMLGFCALRGIIAGTTQNIPSRYAYVGKMLQFPFLVLVFIGIMIGLAKIGPQIFYTLELVLIFNILSMPLTIWYNHILYDIYGDAISEHIEAGVLDGITNYFKNKK